MLITKLQRKINIYAYTSSDYTNGELEKIKYDLNILGFYQNVNFPRDKGGRFFFRGMCFNFTETKNPNIYVGQKI